MNLWSRHWLKIDPHIYPGVTVLAIREGSTYRQEGIPTTPIVRPYLNNIFIYLMPPETPTEKLGRQISGWELKLGMPLNEAKAFCASLQEAIELAEERQKQRLKEKST